MQVVVHVMGSFQVYSMPVFDMIETQLVKNGISNGLLCRLLYRTAYVVIVAFVGITLPFFGDLLGFIGEACPAKLMLWTTPSNHDALTLNLDVTSPMFSPMERPVLSGRKE